MEVSSAKREWVRRWKRAGQARSDICNFYAPEEFKTNIWKKFKRICTAEGTSASDKIRDMVEDYVRLHESGNPQTRIDVIAKLGKPYRANACMDCGKKPKYEAVIKGVKVFLCEIHKDKRKQKDGLQAWREIKK